MAVGFAASISAASISAASTSVGKPQQALLVASGSVRRLLDPDLPEELAYGVRSSRATVLKRLRLASPRDAVPHDAVILEVPGSLDYRGLVTRTVAAACRVSGTQSSAELDEYVNQLVSAVGEAFNNIVIHGYDSESAGAVCVIVEATEDGVGVEVRDAGCSFDPNAVELPEALEPSESGMGLFIIRSFVDHLEYSPGVPNSLTLFKRFPWSVSDRADLL